MPKDMIAVAMRDFGGPEVLHLAAVPIPKPSVECLLIKVAFAGINRPDLLQRQGLYPPPKGASDVLGLEVSGQVVALGDKCQRYKIGDHICALVPGGGYAHYCVVPEAHCLPIPEGLTLLEAASLPEIYFTVWSTMAGRGRLCKGENFLVHGGAGGIGTAAIQLAKAIGARIITTAGSDEKCAFCRHIGADIAINYQSQDFAAILKAQNITVDLILDMVGGDYVARHLAIASFDGRIVNIAWQKGSKITLDLMNLMRKRLTLTGATLRAQSSAAKADIAHALEENVWPLFAKQIIKPIISQTFPLAQVARAHEIMEQGQHIGKLMLMI